jgi:nickel/cobalt exporter
VGADRAEVRDVKRLLTVLAAFAALAAPVAATAHPLGNFTINRYSELDVSGNRVYVVYVLDLAEIPTFQARQAGGVDAGAYARRIAANAHLVIDGRPARLVPVRHELAFPAGQGGLSTTRLEVLLSGPKLTGRSSVAYHDDNYANRIGWSEIVVRSSAGALLEQSSAPTKSISDRLLSYPKNLLQSPLHVTTATASVSAGAHAGTPPALLSAKLLDQRVGVRAVADSGFAKLIAHGRLGGWFLLASLGIAFFWGAAHALSPGHGKSIITAYLVGSRGTARHAVLLGATVTITHTIGVFALGLVTLSLSQFILPEQLYPWLNLVSALLIVGVGLSVLRWRLRDWRRDCAHTRAQAHGHHHHHDHDHGHDHSHDPALGMRRLIGIGVSGGIIPCPSALVVLLAAISLHRVGYGLVLIVAFSFGLAATMTGLGLLAVAARGAFGRVDLSGRAVRLLPALSAVVVLGLGLAMTLRALPHVT